MESSEILSYIGAVGAIATVIALFPEKNRMAAFDFLKNAIERLVAFFRKFLKTAQLETIQKTSPEGEKATGTFLITHPKPIGGIAVTKSWPSEYTIFEVTYRPESEVFPFEKISSSIPLYKVFPGSLHGSEYRHVLSGLYQEDLAIGDEPAKEFFHNFSEERSLMLLAPTRDTSNLSLAISGPAWLKAKTLKI